MKIDILAIMCANLVASVEARCEKAAIARNRLSTHKCSMANLSRNANSNKIPCHNRDGTTEIFGFPLRNRNDVESLVSSSTRFREFKESLAT